MSWSLLDPDKRARRFSDWVVVDWRRREWSGVDGLSKLLLAMAIDVARAGSAVASGTKRVVKKSDAETQCNGDAR